MRKDSYNENELLKRSLKAIGVEDNKTWMLLPNILKETALGGKPTEFQFNHIRVRYHIQDHGLFVLWWTVVNAITGNAAKFYSKDYIGKSGKMRWKHLACEMKKVV